MKLGGRCEGTKAKTAACVQQMAAGRLCCSALSLIVKSPVLGLQLPELRLWPTPQLPIDQLASQLHWSDRMLLCLEAIWTHGMIAGPTMSPSVHHLHDCGSIWRPSGHHFA
jgi:hypothetical protein